jgi:hypothetical protein
VDAAIDQFVAFIGAERDNCVRRARSVALFSILILALLYRTEWTILRPGLAILLIGQLGWRLHTSFKLFASAETRA